MNAKLWTVKEAAEYLGVSVWWVYRHASTAESPERPVLPVVNLGRSVRIDPATLERFVREQEGVA